MEPRLSLVTLCVADLERARRFYVDGLGWPASSASTGDIVFIQLGALGLALYPEKDFAEEIGIARKWTTPGIVLAQNVRSPEEVAEVWRSRGRRRQISNRRTFWGGTSGYFADQWRTTAHSPLFPSPPMAPAAT